MTDLDAKPQPRDILKRAYSVRKISDLPTPDTLADSLLFTHAGCMDGATAAALFVRAGGDRKNVVFCKPNDVSRRIRESGALDDDRFFFVVDVRVDNDMAHYIDKSGHRCAMLDHHSTSWELADRDWCVVDEGFCGCALFWQYLGRDQFFEADEWVNYADLVGTIDDHDRWQNRYPQGDDLGLLTNMLGHTGLMDRFVKRPVPWLDEREGYVVQLARDQRDEYVRRTVPKGKVIKNSEDGWTGAVYVSARDNSTLLHAAVEQRKVDFAFAIDFERMQVSIRSGTPSNDCSQLAKRMGGGGHRTAAGYPITRETMDGLIELVI